MKRELIGGPDFLAHFLRRWSVRLFLNIVDKLPVSPNQITIGNFFTNGLAVVYFFSRGTHRTNLVALFFYALRKFFDFMDGSVARKRGVVTKLGSWLDPAVDIVWGVLVICSIVWGVFVSKGNESFWLLVGLSAMVGFIIKNYMEREYVRSFSFDLEKNQADFVKRVKKDKKARFLDKLLVEFIRPSNFISYSLLVQTYFIIFGALVDRMNFALLLMAASFLTRAGVLFYVYVDFLKSDLKTKKTSSVVKALHRFSYLSKREGQA